MGIRKNAILVAGSLCCVLTLCVMAGCSQEAQVEGETADPEVESQYLPVMYTDGDGDLIQLTPNDDKEDINYFRQRETVPYNTYYLDADTRGCKSCHDDLRQLLEDSPYEHGAMKGADVEWNVTMCLDCHSTGTNNYYTNEHDFADVMHAIHKDDASCFNCHYADTPTSVNPEGDMKLWEEVKYDKLRGITDLNAADFVQDFSYDQDMLTDVHDELFYLNDQYHEWDYERTENEENDVPLDYELRDSWTITISGEVDTPRTFVLGDLLDDPNTPMVTRTVKWHCMISPIGGNGVGQVEVTGIPLSYLTDQCGIKDTATGVIPQGAGGFSDPGSLDLKLVQENEPIVALEMNGEPLTWVNGFPCTIVWGNGTSTGCWAKEFNSLEYTQASVNCYDIEGWPYATYDYADAFYPVCGWPTADYSEDYNNPNVGIYKLKEGQVVKTGEPLTIEGYADAWDKEVVGLEVSMDRGATWTRYDISGTNIEQLVTWAFDFTPEEDGAYYIGVRSVRADGTVTSHPIERMIIASSDVDAASAE